MNINRHNYEAWALDYLEGNLSPVETATFMAFLTDNPDIAAELEMFETNLGTPSSKGPIDFKDMKKDLSAQQITNETFEEFCIAWHEGDLKPNFQSAIEKYISENPEKRKIFEMYGRMKLQPDTSIHYIGKNNLKKLHIPLRRAILISALSAAASVAVIIAINFREGANGDRFVTIHKSTVPVHAEIIESETHQPEIINSEIIKTPERLVSLGHPKNISSEGQTIVDTSKPPIFNLADLPRIEPRIDEIHPVINVRETKTHTESKIKQLKETEVGKILTLGNDFLIKASGMTVEKIISSGVNGINKMTETDLKFQSKSDKNGKIVEFALSSDNFKFKRIVDQN